MSREVIERPAPDTDMPAVRTMPLQPPRMQWVLVWKDTGWVVGPFATLKELEAYCTARTWPEAWGDPQPWWCFSPEQRIAGVTLK